MELLFIVGFPQVSNVNSDRACLSAGGLSATGSVLSHLRSGQRVMAEQSSGIQKAVWGAMPGGTAAGTLHITL